MFRYCPSCASQNIRFEQNKVFRCPDCGLTYYHNTAAATACLIRTRQGIIFLVRGKEPGKGLLDFPGGFVDPGEGVFEGLRREIREELGWDPGGEVPPPLQTCGFPLPPLRGSAPQRPAFTLFASFPNKYPYKNIPYNTCDLFFSMDAPDLAPQDLKREEAEITAIRFIKPEDINLDEIAFESARNAVKLYLSIYQGKAEMFA
jgi:ADP-ribose pyrophosphatase YjhB (NUDIX family)